MPVGHTDGTSGGGRSSEPITLRVPSQLGTAPLGLAKPLPGTATPRQCPSTGTRLLQWGPGADEVENELVGVLLHPGGDVPVHLGKGRGAMGGISAGAGERHGSTAGGQSRGSPATLTMTLRSL